eukprot:m.237369 g.237369  ORF g.237369 m.237369 type:complete len:137 (-) comp33707_c1_seq5:3373-3783(-)
MLPLFSCYRDGCFCYVQPRCIFQAYISRGLSCTIGLLAMSESTACIIVNECASTVLMCRLENVLIKSIPSLSISFAHGREGSKLTHDSARRCNSNAISPDCSSSDRIFTTCTSQGIGDITGSCFMIMWSAVSEVYL